jgi:hypothetical protein
VPDSSTGGYLQQVSGPTEGLDLRRFIGTMLAGVSGISSTLVRPAWQTNPAPVPGIDTNWMAFAILARRADNDPYQIETNSGLGLSMIVHEEMDVLLTFYGPDCIQKAAETRDGFELSQNSESLKIAGMVCVDLSDIIHAPEMVNGRYFDRADTTMRLRREIRREYAVLNFVSASGYIYANRA